VLRYLGDHQYDLKSGGLEEVIHLFRMSMEQRPGNDVYLMDASNAFNSLNRHLGLWNIMKDGGANGLPISEQYVWDDK